MNDSSARQQIVEKIKSSSNILITVSTDPSVDELSAALGLTALLNKMGKYTTAVFSGTIPEAMKFLDPEKTFENTVDSLRDFIIALDKEKADHLRYKVEGDVVKIFITPFRTTITSDDLQFSQGDYNVELVLALGVNKRDNLDVALTAHGRILHDATVATISVGDMKSELGSINWREQHASSLSEMLVSVSEALKSDKATMDEQIATAYLTGIVAATDRFSNNKTSSKVMTMAAQLMAAGANQQLIASKLEEAQEITGSGAPQKDQPRRDGKVELAEGQTTKLDRKQKNKQAPKKPKKDDGSLRINHDPAAPAAETDTDQQPAEVAVEPANQPDQATAVEHTMQDKLDQSRQSVAQQQQHEAAQAAEQNLAEQLSQVVSPVSTTPSVSVADLQQDIAAASADVDDAATQPAAGATPPTNQPSLPQPQHALSGAVGPEEWKRVDAPSVGGTLNATTEQAADDKRLELEQTRNRTILTHGGSGYLGGDSPDTASPINGATLPQTEQPLVDPFSALKPPSETTAPTAYAQTIQPPAPATLADLDKQHRVPAPDEARAVIDAVFDAAPQQYAPPFEMNQPANPAYPAPGVPPLPDFSTLPPLPPPPSADGGMPPVFEQQPAAFNPPTEPQYMQPQPSDPGQFQIPGQ